MFEKILVPTDFSEYAQKVLECVGEIPGVKDVVLLHLIDATDPLARVWDPGTRLEEAKAKVEEQKKYLEGFGLNVVANTEVITAGDVARAIQKTAKDENTSLIVMGARGMSKVSGIFLGSVARDVLRRGTTDVLIMRYKLLAGDDGESLEKFCPVLFSKVLCTTDFSEASDAALTAVKGMDKVKELVLLNVITKGETGEEIDAKTTEAAKKLNAIKGELSKQGLDVKVDVDVGHAAQKIAEAAERNDVSLIVMSSHGKGWLKELMVGSTAYDVVRMGNRPVLVVRSK